MKDNAPELGQKSTLLTLRDIYLSAGLPARYALLSAQADVICNAETITPCAR